MDKDKDNKEDKDKNKDEDKEKDEDKNEDKDEDIFEHKCYLSSLHPLLQFN